MYFMVPHLVVYTFTFFNHTIYVSMCMYIHICMHTHIEEHTDGMAKSRV